MFKIQAAQRMQAGKYMKRADYEKDIKWLVSKTGCTPDEAWEDLLGEEGNITNSLPNLQDLMKKKGKAK